VQEEVHVECPKNKLGSCWGSEAIIRLAHSKRSASTLEATANPSGTAALTVRGADCQLQGWQNAVRCNFCAPALLVQMWGLPRRGRWAAGGSYA